MRHTDYTASFLCHSQGTGQPQAVPGSFNISFSTELTSKQVGPCVMIHSASCDALRNSQAILHSEWNKHPHNYPSQHVDVVTYTPRAHCTMSPQHTTTLRVFISQEELCSPLS